MIWMGFALVEHFHTPHKLDISFANFQSCRSILDYADPDLKRFFFFALGWKGKIDFINFVGSSHLLWTPTFRNPFSRFFAKLISLSVAKNHLGLISDHRSQISVRWNLFTRKEKCLSLENSHFYSEQLFKQPYISVS